MKLRQIIIYSKMIIYQLKQLKVVIGQFVTMYVPPVPEGGRRIVLHVKKIFIQNVVKKI